MFAKACRRAFHFTRPIVISRRGGDKKCSVSIGAYVVLNREGWIVTAYHIVDYLIKLGQSKAAFDEFLRRRAAVKALPAKQRKRQKRLKPEPGSTRAWSAWWGWDGVSIEDIHLLPPADLAVCRLEPFDPSWLGKYPRLKNPRKALKPGTSLCRLGYPLHHIEPIYEEATANFRLPAGTTPLPFFPIEGIFTRQAMVAGEQTREYPLAFLETSSPGLRGQSGGPIFDRRGTVWAIQSHTAHHPLGFAPPVVEEGAQRKEHQFLNVGLGVHPETLVGFLRECGIEHKLSRY
jgi:hypothetical protein